MPDNNLRIRIEGDYFIPQIAGFLTTIDTIYNNIQFLSTKPDDYRDLLNDKDLTQFISNEDRLKLLRIERTNPFDILVQGTFIAIPILLPSSLLQYIWVHSKKDGKNAVIEEMNNQCREIQTQMLKKVSY